MVADRDGWQVSDCERRLSMRALAGVGDIIAALARPGTTGSDDNGAAFHQFKSFAQAGELGIDTIRGSNVDD